MTQAWKKSIDGRFWVDGRGTIRRLSQPSKAMHQSRLYRYRVALAGLAIFASQAQAQPQPSARAITTLIQSASAPPAANTLAHGIIIKLKAQPQSDANPQRTLERLSEVFRQMPLPLGTARPLGGPLTYLVQWERPLAHDETQQLLQALRAHPEVQRASPNLIEEALQAAAPNDPIYQSSQWWLNAAPHSGSRGVPHLTQAWARSTGNAVNVAVLDTGLLRSHPDMLGSRFDAGYDLVGTELNHSGDGDGPDADFSDPGDGHGQGECSGLPAAASTWHGTQVASQVGALTDNALGIAGINWRARVISVRIARKCGALTSTVVEGLRWAGGLSVPNLPTNPLPARIINLSFGSANIDCEPYQDTLDDLRAIGVLVVAAAGDSDKAVVHRPARCTGALAVTALNRDGFKARYASFGPEVGISTVGGDLPVQSASIDPDGAAMSDTGVVVAGNDGLLAPGNPIYQVVSGTSFSAPVVAGVASLMLSVNPSLTLDQLAYGLQITARPHVNSSSFSSLQACDVSTPMGRCYCTTSTCGAGILDAPAALTYASNPAAYGTAPVFGGTRTQAPLTPSGSDSGGGAWGWHWLLMLGALICALRRASRPN